MKTRIIVDSTADLVPEIKARVSTVPLTVHFGQEEYIDGVTIDNRTFYEKLIESDVLPTTSQATPDAFIKEFEKAGRRSEAAVVITLASKFSGTYQSAMIAAADYENIYVVDGTSAAMGTGILVELAFRLLDAGMTAEETAQVLEEEKKKIVVVALVDTLEYLKRGGRISKTAAFAGGVLNIKPVLSVIDGEIHLLGKARGSKMGNNLLVQEIDKAGGIDFSRPVLLGYSGISDALLLKYIEDSRHIWEGKLKEIRYTTVGSVIGTHAGPGAVVVAFFQKVKTGNRKNMRRRAGTNCACPPCCKKSKSKPNGAGSIRKRKKEPTWCSFRREAETERCRLLDEEPNRSPMKWVRFGKEKQHHRSIGRRLRRLMTLEHPNRSPAEWVRFGKAEEGANIVQFSP